MLRILITKNLTVYGEDNEKDEKSFFASTGLEISEDVPLCRRKFGHKHSSQGNKRYGMGEL